MDAKRLAEVLKKLDDQSFRPGDHPLLSAINHPVDGGVKFINWLKNQVNTAAGIPDQYDNPYPLLAPSPDAQSQAAFDLAGMAQVGSFPFAPKSAGGTLGTFIGPKAATWNADKAAAAAKMLDDGVDPSQVWQQHMIGRMPDGNLFSEIDDSGATFPRYSKKQFAPLDEVIDHDELEMAYPHLKNLIFEMTPSGNRAGLSGGRYANNVEFVDFGPRENIEVFNSELSANQNKSIGAHELQHAIQNYEGWGKGGNPFMRDLLEARVPKHSASFQGLEPPTAATSAASGINSNKSIESLLDNDEWYKRLTGEAQARATQDRLNMNMDERRANYPLAGGKLSDIPLEQLIYRYGDKAARLLPATMLGYGMANQKPDNQSIAEALRGQ